MIRGDGEIHFYAIPRAGLAPALTGCNDDRHLHAGNSGKPGDSRFDQPGIAGKKVRRKMERKEGSEKFATKPEEATSVSA